MSFSFIFLDCYSILALYVHIATTYNIVIFKTISSKIAKSMNFNCKMILKGILICWRLHRNAIDYFFSPKTLPIYKIQKILTSGRNLLKLSSTTILLCSVKSAITMREGPYWLMHYHKLEIQCGKKIFCLKNSLTPP